jgi:hypothetical protein
VFVRVSLSLDLEDAVVPGYLSWKTLSMGL